MGDNNWPNRADEPDMEPDAHGNQSAGSWPNRSHQHKDNLDILNDSLLVLESIADICDVPIQQPLFIGRDCTLPNADTAQTSYVCPSFSHVGIDWIQPIFPGTNA